MSIHRILLAATAVAALSACAREGVVAAEPREVKIAQPEAIEGAYVPAGVTFSVTMNEGLGTMLSTVGQSFTATVNEPLVGTRGEILVPEGAVLRGTVARIDTGATPVLALDFESIQTSQGWVDIQAKILSAEKRTHPGPDEVYDPAILGYDAAFIGPVGGVTPGFGYYNYGFDYYDENAREIRVPRGAELNLQLTRPLDLPR